MPTREADVLRELEVEREHLVEDVEELRRGADLAATLRANLPLAVLATFAVGFVLAGGIGAAARLGFRRSREGRAAARVGPYALVYRR
jgi:hypothetical protein